MDQINARTLKKLSKAAKISQESVFINKSVHSNLNKKLLDLEIDQQNNYWRDLFIAILVSLLVIFVCFISCKMQAKKCRKNRSEFPIMRMSDLEKKLTSDSENDDDSEAKYELTEIEHLKKRVEDIENRLGSVGIIMH